MSDTPKPYESDTPETCEAIERWQQGKINIFDEMARLERERDEAREALRETRAMLSHIVDWSPELPYYIKDEYKTLFENALAAARELLRKYEREEAAK
jgi:predicted nuclease with TOPRIM domain